MWKCVNGVIGCDKSQQAEFQWGIQLDIINHFFQSVAVSTHATSSYYDVSLSEHVSGQFTFTKISVLLFYSPSISGNPLAQMICLLDFLKEVASEIAAPLNNLFN